MFRRRVKRKLSEWRIKNCKYNFIILFLIGIWIKKWNAKIDIKIC